MTTPLSTRAAGLFAVAMIGLTGSSAAQTTRRAACAAGETAGLTLPAGFCAVVFAESLAAPRHVAVAPNGDVYVAQRGGRTPAASGVLLRDGDGDGRADVRQSFAITGSATGVALTGEHVYLALNDAVVRFRLGADPSSGTPDTIVSGLPAGRQHAAKSIALGAGGALYINVGAPSNACQDRDRQPGGVGQDPCPLLDSTGGIWRFDAGRLRQTRADGRRFATGLRNMVALTYDAGTSAPYGLSHGRDDLARLYPALYTPEQNAEKPAEEFFRLEEGRDYGWPFCHFDTESRQKLLNPEYGGDGRTAGRCAQTVAPLVGFPAHWAPNALAFYRGTQFPAEYRGGVFIAFHGSWNRAPMPQQGFNVVFQPMAGNGRPAGQWRVFADGFRGTAGGNTAASRPTGVAVGPDGSLYVSDDAGGKIFRIVYVGR